MAGCTQPVESGGQDARSIAAEKLSFVYDASIDQIAFMSCPHYKLDELPNGSDQNRPYFTLRAGAYRNAGLELKDAFYTELGARPLDTKAEILADSPANDHTVLQLAVRNRQDKQKMYRNGELTKGQDYFNVFAELGTPDISKTLVYTPVGTRLKHVRNGNPGGLRFEGDLSYSSIFNFASGSDNPGGAVRVLSSDMLLTLTYTHANDGGLEYLPRSPAFFNDGDETTARTNVFGVGYELRFAKPSGVHASNPEGILASVNEVSLSTDPLTNRSAWDCSAQLQFRIVRPQDAVAGSTANCLKKADPAVLNDTFKTIRNSLRVEDWYVDYDNKCIVSKKGDQCYLPTDVVSYPKGDPCMTNGNATCVAYVSICQRR